MAKSDIFDRLKKDHDRHREMLDRIEDTSGDSEERRALFEQFRIEVTAHAAAEEETLYATMLEKPELRNDGQHSVAEHKELGDLINELNDKDMSSPGWLVRFKTLKHDYLHHIDEEEQDMFPAAADGLSERKAETLKQRFERRKPDEIDRAIAGCDEGDDRD